MEHRDLPDTIQKFMASCRTIVAEQGTPEFPYADWPWRVVPVLCLSGRVQPTCDGRPNRTDVNRVCKQANFNQYWLADVGEFLFECGVLASDYYGPYTCGPAFEAFWQR